MNTTYFANLVMGNLFHTDEEPGIPTGYYMGLSTTSPSVDGTNVTEPSGGGYTRIQLTSLSSPVDGKITNSSEIEFPRSSTDWGVVTNYVVFDQPSGGNLLFYNELSNSRHVDANSTLLFDPNTLEIIFKNVIN